MYVKKAAKKGRSQAEVDQIIFWLTGYDAGSLKKQVDANVDFEIFFEQAPQMNPNASLITGSICGVRVETIEDKVMRKIRWLDKLVDELAKGKSMEKILRSRGSHMQTKPIETSSGTVVVIENDTPVLTDVQSALDLIASVSYKHNAAKIAIYKTAVAEDFFRLSTGLLGEIVQKFVTYGCRIAIIGDFSGYTSKPLHDYIYECNKGTHLNFAASESEAVRRLGGTN